MKGAIARGKITFDSKDQLYFGQALVDAYLMEEELKFYGVAFHHSAEKLVIEALENMYYPDSKRIRIYYPIHECSIPLKTCKCKHYLIAWHKLNAALSQDDITEDSKNWLASMSLTVSGAPRVYIDNTIAIIEEINKTPKIESIEKHRVKTAEVKRKRQKKKQEKNPQKIKIKANERILINEFIIFAKEFLQRQGNGLLKIAEAERCPKRVRSAF